MREFKNESAQCACCAPKEIDKVTKAYARGKDDERERIIKLLENAIPSKNIKEMSVKYYVERKVVDTLIALIKGENK